MFTSSSSVCGEAVTGVVGARPGRAVRGGGRVRGRRRRSGGGGGRARSAACTAGAARACGLRTRPTASGGSRGPGGWPHLDADEQRLDGERGLPPLVRVEQREADLARRVDVRVEERLIAAGGDQLEAAGRRLVRVLFGECPAARAGRVGAARAGAAAGGGRRSLQPRSGAGAARRGAARGACRRPAWAAGGGGARTSSSGCARPPRGCRPCPGSRRPRSGCPASHQPR